MKVRYQAPKYTRVNYGYTGATILGPGTWYQDGIFKPNSQEDRTRSFSSHSEGIRTVKAFKRKCAKWKKYLPKGTEIILVSKWVGHNVYYTVK